MDNFMNIIILGAAGFIGTNLFIKLAEDKNNHITLVDTKKKYFSDIINYDKNAESSFYTSNIEIVELQINVNTDFERLLAGQDIVFHLVSTTMPSTSNQHIAKELTSNVVMTAKMLDACVKCSVEKVVFISSGGTVYGKEGVCPLKEDTATNPISSYGIQKITIEKLLNLYQYMYGLNYRVVRLANPYGPYQRPNGVLGVVTTFTYNTLKNKEIVVYGNGTVIRDFIYIDDAIRGILQIANGKDDHRTFNLGCGYGASINQVIETIQIALDLTMKVTYKNDRKVDVPVNYLDISRYENAYGKLNPIELKEGVLRTAQFMRENYNI